jgi:hypothetical protein
MKPATIDVITAIVIALVIMATVSLFLAVRGPAVDVRDVIAPVAPAKHSAVHI